MLSHMFQLVNLIHGINQTKHTEKKGEGSRTEHHIFPGQVIRAEHIHVPHKPQWDSLGVVNTFSSSQF